MEPSEDSFATAEYVALLTELEWHLSEIAQLYRFTTTAVVAILAWGIAQRNSIVLLTPAPLLTFSVLMMLSHSESVFRIASYVRTFIEPTHPHVRWQTRLRLAATERKLAEVFHNATVGLSYLALSVFSLGMSWVYAGHPEPVSGRFTELAIVAVACGSFGVAAYAVWRIALNRSLPDDAHNRVWATVIEKEASHREVRHGPKGSSADSE